MGNTYDHHCQMCGAFISTLQKDVNYVLPAECDSCREKLKKPKVPKGYIYFHGELMKCANNCHKGYWERNTKCRKCDGRDGVKQSCDECNGDGNKDYCDWPCWLCNREEYDSKGGAQP